MKLEEFRGEVKMKLEEFRGELKCNVGAKRMWRAGFEDSHNCLPKAVPKAIMRVDCEGDVFQPGSFKIFHFQKDYAIRVSKENRLEHLVESTKEKLLEIHDDSLRLKIEIMSGGFLGVMVTYYDYTIHIVDGPLPDTCVVQWCFHFKPISPKHHPMMCERLKEVLPLSFKALEAYLLSNDDYKD